MRWIPGKTSWLVALSCALPGCGGAPAPPLPAAGSPTPRQGGTLHAATFSDVRSLDAATAFDTVSSVIESLLYDTLVSYDAEGRLTPQLAERWALSDDGRRYTFSLRRGVLMHDGRELTADDVKRSMERALHPDTPCPVPSYYDKIEGYAAYHAGRAPTLSGVRVSGRYELQISLSSPDSTFLLLLALPIMAPLCESAGRTWRASFNLEACGAGPFKLEAYEAGLRVRVVRHHGYWKKGEPKLDAVEWQLGVQPFTQRFKFERGELDYLRELTEADSQQYRSSAAWAGQGAWESSLVTLGVFMNTQLPPFDDVHFRRAVAFAIDREQVSSVRPGNTTPRARMVPASITPDRPGQAHHRYDPARALEELALAGYPYDPATGRGGYPEAIEYLAIIDSFSQQSAELIQQQLARVGVRLRLSVVGFPTFLAKSGRPRAVKMGFAGWHADYPDPSTFFEPILSSRSIQEEDSQNASFFANAELDALLDEARISTDEARRAQLFERAEQLVVEQAPWVPVHDYRAFELWQPYLRGYRPHPLLPQYVRGAWLDRAERAASRRAPRTTLAWALGRGWSAPR